MPMSTQTRKNTARIKRTIATRQTVDALQPAEKPYIAWDDRLTGFGVRVLPSGTKSFILNYRPGGGRKAPNRRIVLGRCERTSPDAARRMAEEMLVRIAAGEDPAAERAKARAMPTLRGERPSQSAASRVFMYIRAAAGSGDAWSSARDARGACRGGRRPGVAAPARTPGIGQARSRTSRASAAVAWDAIQPRTLSTVERVGDIP